jgi:hypothetical protein
MTDCPQATSRAPTLAAGSARRAVNGPNQSDVPPRADRRSRPNPRQTRPSEGRLAQKSSPRSSAGTYIVHADVLVDDAILVEMIEVQVSNHLSHCDSKGFTVCKGAI